MITPKTLLIDGHEGIEAPFEDQTQIVIKLTEMESSPYYQKKLSTVRVQINQVFNGKRRLSNNLKKGLIVALRDLGSETTGIINRLEEVFDAHFEHEESKRTITHAEDDFFYLLESIDAARSVHIVTESPLSLVSFGTKRIEEMVHKVLDIVNPFEKEGTKPIVKFFVPKDRLDPVGMKFWQNLAEHYQEGNVNQNLHEILQKLSEKNSKGEIEIWEVPEIFIDVTYCGIDIEELASEGFLTHIKVKSKKFEYGVLNISRLTQNRYLKYRIKPMLESSETVNIQLTDSRINTLIKQIEKEN